MTAPYSDLADRLWDEYLSVLRAHGFLSREAICIAGVLHTIGRDGWVMGEQGYTYGSNANDLKTVRNRAKAYPDADLSAWMVKALDDVQCGHCHKHYGGRRWNWPKDYARPKLKFADNVLTIDALCENELAEVNRDARYDHVELNVYTHKPDFKKPKSERIRPVMTYRSDTGRWSFAIRGRPPELPDRCYVVGGLVGPGSVIRDDLEIEWSGKAHLGTEMHDPVDAGVADHDRPDISALISHCEKWKATQPASNTGHHERWETVMTIIRRHDFETAKLYAKRWAVNGWRPWIDLRAMLTERLETTGG